MAQRVKRLPAIWVTGVQSLVQEEPLEKETATHSSTLAWKIPWTEKPGRLHGVAKSQIRLSNFTFTLGRKSLRHSLGEAQIMLSVARQCLGPHLPSSLFQMVKSLEIMPVFMLPGPMAS